MKKTIVLLFTAAILISTIALNNASAQPYGTGAYGNDLPYGDQTSLSIATDGDISIGITPTESGSLATGASQVTVTSTDVAGYKLYIRALNDTNMDNLGTSLPASSNLTPLPLENNSWGYNTDGSNNFVGITMTDSLVKSTTGHVKNGETTTITYGLKLDMGKPAGEYSAAVIYTATPQTD